MISQYYYISFFLDTKYIYCPITIFFLKKMLQILGKMGSFFLISIFDPQNLHFDLNLFFGLLLLLYSFSSSESLLLSCSILVPFILSSSLYFLFFVLSPIILVSSAERTTCGRSPHRYQIRPVQNLVILSRKNIIEGTI
jgi:hypothetical protein